MAGRRICFPHTQLKGRQWPIPWEQWDYSMWRVFEPSGPYISKSAAAYPPELNKQLADKWVRAAAVVRLRNSQSNAMVRTGRWSNTLVAKHLWKPTLHDRDMPQKQAVDLIRNKPASHKKNRKRSATVDHDHTIASHSIAGTTPIV